MGTLLKEVVFIMINMRLSAYKSSPIMGFIWLMA